MKAILIVEDDPGIQELLRLNLVRVNYKVRQAMNAEQAWGFLKSAVPDVMLVDWNLPWQSGIELVRALRSQPRYVAMPIIMVTARSTEQDKLEAFDAGVDDVVSKPFHVRELLSRINAKLVRAQLESTGRTMELSGLTVCLVTQQVKLNETPIEMGGTEMRILYHLVRQPDKVLARTELVTSVWGVDAEVQVRTVDAYMVRLRRRLVRVGWQHQIHTVRSAGYRLEPCRD